MIFHILRKVTRSPIINWFIVKSHSSVPRSAVSPPESLIWLFISGLILPAPPLILVHLVEPPHHGVDGIECPDNFPKEWGTHICLISGLLSQLFLSFGVFKRISNSWENIFVWILEYQINEKLKKLIREALNFFYFNEGFPNLLLLCLFFTFPEVPSQLYRSWFSVLFIILNILIIPVPQSLLTSVIV